MGKRIVKSSSNQSRKSSAKRSAGNAGEKCLDDLDHIFKLQAEFCGIFADPKRLKIIWCLKDGERSVGDIADQLGLPISNVSQHLRILRDKGAIIARRDGRNIFYKVANRKFLKGSALIREGVLEEMEKKARR